MSPFVYLKQQMSLYSNLLNFAGELEDYFVFAVGAADGDIFVWNTEAPFFVNLKFHLLLIKSEIAPVPPLGL